MSDSPGAPRRRPAPPQRFGLPKPPVPDSRYHPGLARLAAVTAAATLGLIALGGLVTSHAAGLAVPDWPTTYGHNLFLFPVSKWVGGIFYEHTHRLWAALVGLLTVALAVWLWLVEPRRWLRRLGLLAVLTVVGQGVLGGLRVTTLKDELGIVHAALAQLFFCLVSALALCTSRWWTERAARAASICLPRPLLYWFGVATALILTQLILGAAMRHQHAGLAVPDFPTAYGRFWPALDAASIASYNQLRSEATHCNPITAWGVVLHMAHRFLGLLILGAASVAAWQTLRRLGRADGLSRLALGWLGLIGMQVGLGAATVWTGKAATVSTLHVVVGSLCLVAPTLWLLLAFRRRTASPAGPLPAAVGQVAGVAPLTLGR